MQPPSSSRLALFSLLSFAAFARRVQHRKVVHSGRVKSRSPDENVGLHLGAASGQGKLWLFVRGAGINTNIEDLKLEGVITQVG